MDFLKEAREKATELYEDSAVAEDIFCAIMDFARKAYLSGQERMRAVAAAKASEAFVKYATPQSVAYAVSSLPLQSNDEKELG